MSATIPYRLANGPGNLPDADKFMANYDWLTSLLFGSFIFNGGLENWNLATTFSSPAAAAALADYWVALNSGTSSPTFSIARESSTIDSGTYSAKINITVAGSSDSIIGMSQALISASRFQSLTVLFGMKIKTSTTNKVRLKIYDGTTTAYSSYHDGDGSWQLLQVPLTVSATATSITVYLEVTGNFTGSVYADSGYFYSVPASMNTAAREQLGFSTLVDPPQIAGLNKYRRPRLVWVSVTTVDVEDGIYDGTANNVYILFPDGDLRAALDTTHYRFDITRNAALTGTKQSGLRTSLSEATNTWYALYAVKTDDGQWVTVGDTTLPLRANFSTLNTNFGTNAWIYLGLIRNGDNAGATGDILNFVQSGNETLFQNATNNTATGFAGGGLRLATTAGATSLTYTYSAGTGTTNIPGNVGHCNFMCCFATVTGKLAYNSGGTILYSMAGAASAIGQILVRAPAAGGIQLQNGPSSSIAYTIQLLGFTDSALGVGANPLL